MATSSLNSIRVRLFFDYPPPSTPDCRMCWLLVDLNKCRVVADLSSNIKEKFGYSRKTVLDLFIDECFLPSTESIYLIRDNDSISIKSSSLIYINGNEACLDSTVTKSKKREREDKTEIPQNPTKKKKLKDTQNGDSALVVDCKINHKKKKKKDRKESVTKSETPQKTSPVKVKANTSRNKTSPKNTCSSSNTSKTTVRSPESTSGSSESSEDESQKKVPSKPKPKQISASKKPSAAQKESSSSDSSPSDSKPAPRKNSVTSQPQPSSSSTPPLSSSASSQSQVKPLDKKSKPASSSTQDQTTPQDKKAETSDSDSSDIELVIKKPNLDGFGLKIAGLNSSHRGRGNARGRGRGANRGGFDRAKGTPWKQQFQHSYENDEEQRRPDTLTNQSLILQNPPEPVQKRDYSTLPLLAAPPAVGQNIAFKLLELTENYTPEVSEYKEGKIKAYNPYTNVLELELLAQPQAPTEPGKFDLVYQNADGSEVVEYAVTHGSQVTERWDALLEPRLIVDHVG